MKTLKTLFSVLVLAAVFSVNATAQDYTAEVSATANVLSTIEIEFAGGADEIQFGNLALNDETAIVKSDGSAHEYVGESATPAVGTLKAENGAEIFIKYTNAILSNNAGDNTLNMTTTVHVQKADNSYVSIDSAGGSVTLDAAEVDLYVGGSINLSGAVAGSYSTGQGVGSPVTITFNYN